MVHFNLGRRIKVSQRCPLDKICRLLGSVQGTSRVFMFTQYLLKVVAWHLRRKQPTCMLAFRINNLISPLADLRLLLKLHSMIGLTHWIIQSERNPYRSRTLQNLCRLQNVANFISCPMEQLWWLGAHKVIPLSKNTMTNLGLWGCRLWLLTILLQFIQWHQEVQYVSAASIENESPEGDDTAYALDMAEKSDEYALRRQKLSNIHFNGLINIAYLPLAIHWSFNAPPSQTLQLPLLVLWRQGCRCIPVGNHCIE
ncbi:hypothetical protein BC829DRAFT_199000 [Chytridium lagenaria]|nr:hypothetical protein BC829DRAFT_199000 [Chytridium lagenaria]